MVHERDERKARNTLSEGARRQFEILESVEKGQMVAVPKLCEALESNSTFFSFSCLSGDHLNKELGYNLGILFTERRMRATEKIFEQLGSRIIVFIDDTEPIRIWRWPTPQEEITEWCRMVVEDTAVPESWDVRLWSETESLSSLEYQKILAEVRKPEHALVVSRRLAHMREFPNRKIKDLRGKELEDAARHRVAHYALQGLVLEQIIPNGVLLQAETPWAVKDPLYQTLRVSSLPIIHPFEERR